MNDQEQVIDAPSTRPQERVGLALVAIFYGVLTLFWCGPILLDPAHVAVDVGDPLHMAWTMAWVGHQLIRDPLALFQSNNFYPYANSLAFGDHLLPEGVLALPVNLVSGNAVLALNLVTGFGLWSSALVAFLLVSRLLGSRAAGLVAGSVLVFNSFIQGELLRVNVLQLQGWSLALYFLWRYTERPSWGRSVAFAVSLALQGLSGTYYAIYSAILVPGFVAAAYIANRRLPSTSEAWRLAAPALATGVAGWLFLSPYRSVAAMSLAQKPIADGADLAAFLLPGPDLWLWRSILPHAPRGESSHFLGYVPPLLAAFSVWALFIRRDEQRPAHSYLALTALVLLSLGGLISLGAFPRFMGSPLGESPYLFVLRWIPTLRGMATVERASVMVHIGIAFLAAIGAERLLRGRRCALPLALGLAALAAAEQWSKPGPGFRVPAGAELPEVYRYLVKGRGPVVELPLYPDRLLRFRALYPYFSTYHWRPVPIGRASFYPPAHDYLANLLQSFPDSISVAALRVAGIEEIVVHPLMWQNRRGARLRSLDGPDFQLVRTFLPELSAGARELDLGEERIYRLTPRPQIQSPCRPEREIERAGTSIRSSASEGTERIRDGDLATSWSTVISQKEGDFIELQLSELQDLAAIRLLLGSRTSDFPTALRVETSVAAGEWQGVEPTEGLESAGETLRDLFASDPLASITIRLPRAAIRAVRLVVGQDPSRPGWNPWSIAELRLFSECSVSEKTVKGVTP